MPQIPVLSDTWDFLTTPSYPRTAVSIGESQLALVSLKHRRREFEIVRLSVVGLTAGLVEPHFTNPNITDEPTFLKAVGHLVSNAGLERLRRTAVALPQAAVRSMVVDFEHPPESQSEVAQMLDWRVERTVGVKSDELRISKRRLSFTGLHPGGSLWFVTAAHRRVMEQYDRIFKALEWQVGLTMPDYLAEAQWLVRSGVDGDQVLVSLNERGFVAVIVRRGEPVLVRQVVCTKQEQDDEFFRLIAFYRDRITPRGEAVNISNMLVTGSTEDRNRFREVLTQAIEAPVTSLDLEQLGLRGQSTSPFAAYAAAAGLSTCAWSS